MVSSRLLKRWVNRTNVRHVLLMNSVLFSALSSELPRLKFWSLFKSKEPPTERLMVGVVEMSILPEASKLWLPGILPGIELLPYRQHAEVVRIVADQWSVRRWAPRGRVAEQLVAHIGFHAQVATPKRAVVHSIGGLCTEEEAQQWLVLVTQGCLF
jgi:hypothetical protein